MTARRELFDWKEAVLHSLKSIDPDSTSFILARNVHIGFLKLGAHVSAVWMPGKKIFFNSKYFSVQTNPNDAHLQSVLIHEVCHLKQGLVTALSVYGELEAWQLGFRVYRQLTGLPYQPALVELMELSLSLNRITLRQAQALMQAYAGKEYRADLLPLYPIGGEIRYWFGLLRNNI